MIAGVVLAAGTSSRLGGRPKQLLPLEGRPITQHVIDAALAAGLNDVVVVLGHATEEVEAALELKPPARAVINPDYGAGQSSSLRAGLEALSSNAEAAVILLGDQPGIRPEAVQAVIEQYQQSRGPVVRASYGGRAGHPVLLDRSLWSQLEALEGDRGARELLADHPEWVVSAAIAGEPPADIDNWADYEQLIRRAKA